MLFQSWSNVTIVYMRICTRVDQPELEKSALCCRFLTVCVCIIVRIQGWIRADWPITEICRSGAECYIFCNCCNRIDTDCCGPGCSSSPLEPNWTRIVTERTKVLGLYTFLFKTRLIILFPWCRPILDCICNYITARAGLKVADTLSQWADSYR